MHAVRNIGLNRPATKDVCEAGENSDPRTVINTENRLQMERMTPLRATVPSSNCKDYPDTKDDQDEDGEDGQFVMPGLHSVEALKEEIDRMREDKIKSIEEIELHKKRVTYAIVFGLFSFALAIGMIVWRFSAYEPPYSELRQRLINTPHEEHRICQTVYPKISKKQFDPAIVGDTLILTDYLEDDDPDKITEGAEKARVNNILQSETSYSGFLRVNSTYNSSLFFWFFPARVNAAESPLVLWLEGGPGWPTMYGLFKVSYIHTQIT